MYLEPTESTDEVKNLINEIERAEVVLRLKFNMGERRRTMPWMGIFTEDKKQIFTLLEQKKISYAEAKQKCLDGLHGYYRQKQNN